MRFFLTIAFLLLSLPAMAAVTVTQPLTFGEFALTDNSAPRSMSISALGVLSKDTQFVTIIPPQEAIVDVSGFPTKTNLIINITFNNLTSVDGGDSFTISTPNIRPNNPKTDNAGEITLRIGATLTTSGGGGFYPDSTYNGLMTVSVNY